MAAATNKQFIARTIYHHRQRTDDFVTLLVYRDENGAYELFDGREPKGDYLAGSEDYIFDEWGKKNRQLVQDGFIRDNLMGDHKWQQFIG